jgi:hypothetical protein
VEIINVGISNFLLRQGGNDVGLRHGSSLRETSDQHLEYSFKEKSTIK